VKTPGTVTVYVSDIITVDDKNTKEVMQNIQQWIEDKLT
jgi:hypothetical protein